jgi:Fic family protein
MNCYYSNLIEGHNTHPIDIERAMSNDYSQDKTKRDLQLEAVAHVNVQSWIDNGGLKDRWASKDAILEIHRRFCEALPDDLLYVEDPSTKKRVIVIPGELRMRDVQVGHLVAISPGAIPRFLERYEQIYSNLGVSELVLATAAAHHRLLWVHPFLDGNGRVARLLSSAQLLATLNTGGIWSIARGLARAESDYKQLLVNCDHQRWNDLDGRGNLSEEALVKFTRFFLQTCLDQVKFMGSLIQPDRLRDRILAWAQRESKKDELLPNATAVLEAVLFRGELPRSAIPGILGLGDRQARRVVSGLVKRGVLVADSDRAPLHLAFPAALAPHWMPGLFPDSPEN